MTGELVFSPVPFLVFVTIKRRSGTYWTKGGSPYSHRDHKWAGD